MKKKYIWLLTLVMTITMIWLIIMQGRWIKNSLIVREQQLTQSVNKALYRVVNKIEERETVLQITNETVTFSTDSTALPGTDAFMKKGEDKYERNAESATDMLVFKGDSGTYQIPVADTAEVRKAFGRDKLKQDIVSKLDKKTVFVENIINKLIRKEINIEERISKNYLNKVLEESFKLNGIDLPYEFAVRDGDNDYLLMSDSFNLNYVRKTYETLLFPNDVLSSNNYLVVYFTKDKSYIREEMPQPVVTSVILTIIISLTFSLTIFIIYRQRKLSELKNDFISNMTHELKTPVSTISLASQMLDDSNINLDKKRLSGILKIIDDESKRLSFQIEKVLQTSLFEKGRIHMKTDLLDVHDIINTSAKNMKLRLAEKGGSLREELNADNTAVAADEMHLTNVFYNLLDNAVKYSRDDVPPEIVVSTENTKNGIRIKVSDNGIGISPEHRKRVFNKFYRVQKGDVHNVKGFGLGLSYVKRVIEEHKGKISVESNTGAGTVFKIFLPQNVSLS